jgi:RNA polymerase sigma-B factor
MAATLEPTRADADRTLFARYLSDRDPVDRELLVERFLPLARRLAGRYRRADEPFDDLLQVACLGLVKAIDRYDLDRETAFSSFAVPTIVGELKRHFRDRTWSVRVPRDLQELVLRVERAAAQLGARLGRQPSVVELAEAVGATDEEVLEALQAAQAQRAASLQAPRGTDGEDDPETLGDGLGVDEDGFGRAEQRAMLASLMPSISAREREVLRLRFEDDLTQEEIGRRIGVSQMQVSRIIRGALERLRAASDRRPGRASAGDPAAA